MNEIVKKDFDVTVFSAREIYELMYNELKIALESIRSSQYWAHVMFLREKDCAVKNLKLEDGDVYPCRKLCVEWREISGCYGNTVEVIISPFGVKYRDVMQNIVFEKESLNKIVKKIMLERFPNSSYLEKCEKLKCKDALSV